MVRFFLKILILREKILKRKKLWKILKILRNFQNFSKTETAVL